MDLVIANHSVMDHETVNICPCCGAAKATGFGAGNVATLPQSSGAMTYGKISEIRTHSVTTTETRERSTMELVS